MLLTLSIYQKQLIFLAGKKVNGKELETISNPEDLEKLNINMASSKEILNLREHGWDMEKAEGLTLFLMVKQLRSSTTTTLVLLSLLIMIKTLLT